jgi:hypothetical protein
VTLALIVDDAHPLAEQYAYDLRRLGGHESLIAADETRRDSAEPRAARQATATLLILRNSRSPYSDSSRP